MIFKQNRAHKGNSLKQKNLLKSLTTMNCPPRDRSGFELVWHMLHALGLKPSNWISGQGPEELIHVGPHPSVPSNKHIYIYIVYYLMPRAHKGPILLRKLIILIENHKIINKNLKIVNLEILKVRTWFGDKDLFS